MPLFDSLERGKGFPVRMLKKRHRNIAKWRSSIRKDFALPLLKIEFIVVLDNSVTASVWVAELALGDCHICWRVKIGIRVVWH